MTEKELEKLLKKSGRTARQCKVCKQLSWIPKNKNKPFEKYVCYDCKKRDELK